MSDAVVEIADLRVTGGRRTLLAIERLSIDRGDVFAVLGPNGAGKTTLLKALVGFVRAAGRLRVLGHDVPRLAASAMCRLRRRVGYLPQLMPSGGEMPLTLREVVAVGRTGVAGLCRPLRSEDWRIVDEWIERLGLAGMSRQGWGELSGGEQRKTLIAKAMVQQPEVLLLDEPTANLDLSWRERIVDTLEQLYAQTRLTVVLVCHELEVLPACCRRVMVLADGRPAATGAPEDVLTSQRVAAIYGAGLEVVRAGGRYATVPAAGRRS